MMFSDDAWAATADIRARIDRLPLLLELADGTLDPERFVEYLVQDDFYLSGYARALAMLAARAPSPPVPAVAELLRALRRELAPAPSGRPLQWVTAAVRDTAGTEGATCAGAGLAAATFRTGAAGAATSGAAAAAAAQAAELEAASAAATGMP